MKGPVHTNSFAFGPFVVEPDANRLLRNGDVLLTGKPVETLVALLEHRDRPVEKDELIRLVWRDAFVSEDSLTQSISALRKALGDDSSQPQYIATIPRRGYRFIGTVDAAPAAAGTPEAVLARPEAVAPVAAPPPVAPARGPWLPLAAAAAGILLVVAFVMSRGSETSSAMPAARAIRFTQPAPAGTTLASTGILSPDGRQLAFVARDNDDGRYRLWLKALDGASARPIEGTEGAFRPFWSPDSESIGFFADGRLKRVSIGGGAPMTIAPVGYRPSGGAWSASGEILYSDRLSPLYLVPDSGSAPPRAVTTLDQSKSEGGHYVLQFLPDGRRFLFFVDSADATQEGTYIGSLDSDERTRVLDANASAVTFAPPNHLLFVRERLLMAQQIEPATGRLVGSPLALREDVSTVAAQLSAAPAMLAFGGDTASEHLMWFDRAGRQLGPVADSTNMHNPALSPDGRQLLADSRGIWLVDLERGAKTHIADGNLPLWSSDGRSVLFTSRREPAPAIFMRPMAGRTEDERVLVGGPQMKLSGDWSSDGRSFVYVTSDPDTRLDISWIGMDAPDTAQTFLETGANEMQPALSPDGRWVAYTSDETGRWEIYVQAFPRGGAKRAISTAGGVEPRWTRGGRELVFMGLDGTITAVEMSTGEALEAGASRTLFRAPLGGDITRYRNHYAVTADGQRFLVVIADESTREPISVVVNWDALIAR